MRRSLLLASAFAAAAGAVPAADSAGDRLKSILQKPDLPAKADYSSMPLPARTIAGLASIGVRAKGATFHASTGNSAQAAKLYLLSVREARKRPNRTTALWLPRYGDAQFGHYL